MMQFHEKCGDRIDLSDGGQVATRVSGVNQGVVFLELDPFEFESGPVIGIGRYFEITVMGMEKRTQTLGLGVTSALPPKPMHLYEKATQLPNSWMVGYDLPKLYVNGKDTARIETAKWRPLKNIQTGDRLGFLLIVADDASGTIIVFQNGEQKVELPVSGMGGVEKFWGVVDISGSITSVRVEESVFDMHSLQSISRRGSEVPPKRESAQRRRSSSKRGKVDHPALTDVSRRTSARRSNSKKAIPKETPEQCAAFPDVDLQALVPEATELNIRGRGDRIDCNGLHAKRRHGINNGVVIFDMGPTYDVTLPGAGPRGRDISATARYFEFTVAEMEKRSQAFALGITSSFPTRPMHIFEKATSLPNSWILGYDLPRLYVNGKETAKIETAKWRPLKDVRVDDRLGLLVVATDSAAQLAVFQNRRLKTKIDIQHPGPVENLLGVIDIHGSLVAVDLGNKPPPRSSPRLSARKSQTRELMKQATMDYSGYANRAQTLQEQDAGRGNSSPRSRGKPVVKNEKVTEMEPITECSEEPLQERRDEMVRGRDLVSRNAHPDEPRRKRERASEQDSFKHQIVRSESENKTTRREPESQLALIEEPKPVRSQRQVSFEETQIVPHDPQIVVYLISEGRQVEVPRRPFIVGRDPAKVHLILKDPQIPPDSVSRVHAQMVPTRGGKGCQVVDLKSMNGTYLNDVRIECSDLQDGDKLEFGKHRRGGRLRPGFVFTVRFACQEEGD